MRLAKEKYRSKQSVVLKFYWDEVAFQNTIDVHERLVDSEHVCR